jgi:hypothetical protein
VAQVQHEQQLLAAKAEQQAALQEARQQARRLQQQVDELRQHLLQQREAQHTSLLAELAAFKQLQEEPSAASLATSSKSDAADTDAGAGGAGVRSASTQLHASNGAITCGSDPAAMHEFRGFTPPAAVADACAQAVAALESNTGLPEQLWDDGMRPQRQQQQHGAVCGRSDADQQRSEPAGSAAGGEPDAMSSLIAAVLGSGPRGQQQMMQHRQHMRQQQQQLTSEVSSSDSGHAAKLDRVLGMSAMQGQARGGGGGPPAAVSKAPSSGAAAGGINTTTSSSSKGGMSQPAAPWRPSSASLIKASAERRQHEQQQQLQQWQAFQQHSEQQQQGGGGSIAGSRSPSPSSPDKQGATALPALVCARCGMQEGSGECCFHPGLVSAPGPLLFGPEWHACK